MEECDMGRSRCLSYGIIMLLLFFFVVSVKAEEPGEGYDENTEITIRGPVMEVVREMRGPVILRIQYRDMIYHVITAPMWYLRQQNLMFSGGIELEVTGSRFMSGDGKLYLIARKIREVQTGRELLFRDLSLRPCWRGMRFSR
jgi:hypothetical protein